MSAFELCTVIGIKTNEPATTTGSESFWSRCRRNLNPTEEQRRILMIIGIELVIIVVLYQWRATRWLLYPFELIGTVFHEFGHAMTVSPLLSIHSLSRINNPFSISAS